MNNINEAVVLAEEKQEQLKHYFDSQVYIICFIYTELLQIIYRLKVRLALNTHYHIMSIALQINFYFEYYFQVQ